MKLNKFLLIVGLLVLILAGCSKREVILPSWNALTEPQLNEFLKMEQVDPLVVKNTKNTTIILYEKPNGRGTYQVSSGKNGRIQIWSKGFGGEEGVLKPVTVEYYGTQDPDIPIASFAVIVINESELLEKAHKVKARYSDGQVVSDMFNNNKAVILPIINRKTLAELSEVTIYDKEGKELFRQ